MAVPRRLLVARHRHGRPRPRLQGRRELHQRAAPVHHVQHRQGRDLQHAPRPTTSNGPISTVTLSDGDASANIPTEAVRASTSRTTGASSDRLTLNLGLRYDLIDRLPVRSVEEPELRARCRRPAQAGLLDGHRGPRELRPDPEERHEQLPAAHRRARYDVARQRQGRHSRRLGHLHRLRLHQLERAVRRGRRDAARASARCSTSTTRPASATRTAASTGSASRSRTSPSQNQVDRRRGCRCSASGSIRGCSCRITRQTQRRLVARADAQHGRHRRLRQLDGRDLNIRPRLNQRIPGSRRSAASRALRADAQPEHQRQPAGGQPRRERVQRADPGGRRRLSHGIDFTASYTLANGESTIGTAADELNTANIQDPNNPFDDPRAVRPEPSRPTRATAINAQRDVPGAVAASASRRSSSSARRCRST